MILIKIQHLPKINSNSEKKKSKKKEKREEKGRKRSLEQGVGSLVEGGKEVDCNCKTPFAGKQRAINVIAV